MYENSKVDTDTALVSIYPTRIRRKAVRTPFGKSPNCELQSHVLAVSSKQESQGSGGFLQTAQTWATAGVDLR